jgi:glucokinase
MNPPGDDYALAVEIGGTKIQFAIGTADGRILSVEQTPAASNADEILARLDARIPEALTKARAEGIDVSRAAVGFGGPVDSERGVVLKSFQVSGWDEFPLAAHFEDTLDLPTILANDSNAAGWAEYRLGSGQGTRHFLYMNIGSGIGGALVVDGRLHDGQGFGAGELGHTWVPDWTAEAPGAATELERICSGWAIEERVAATWGAGDERIDCARLGALAEQGDARAVEEIQRVAESLGIALANAVNLLNPERIAIGGGVSLLGDTLLDPLRDAVDRHTMPPLRGTYTITQCALAEHVVLAGALLLAPDAR